MPCLSHFYTARNKKLFFMFLLRYGIIQYSYSSRCADWAIRARVELARIRAMIG